MNQRLTFKRFKLLQSLKKPVFEGNAIYQGLRLESAVGFRPCLSEF